jgi:hypothetical protein
MKSGTRSTKATGAVGRIAPAKAELNPISVGGYSFGRAESYTDWEAPGGSKEIKVAVESRFLSRSEDLNESQRQTWPKGCVTVDVEVERGPDGQDHHHAPIELCPADLPGFLATVVTAVYLAERNGVIDPLYPEGHAVVEALYRALPKGD